MNQDTWPKLSYEQAKGTYKTMQLWTQIAGKIKVARLPWTNHSWHTTLFVTPFGLTTGDLPGDGKNFQINFDFLHHQLQIRTSHKEQETFDLTSLSVAACYRNIFTTLKNAGIECEIYPVPNEMEEVTPFHQNTNQKEYNPQNATDIHMALLKANEIFTIFRSGFIGKCSPVHFFWGGFDLAVSRFSGETAPLHPGGILNLPDWVAQEAYSHEVCSCGFWPGNDAFPHAAFYSYIYPEPNHYPDAAIRPAGAYYHQDLREYILPYEDVRQAPTPKQTVLDFLKTTYEAAANLAQWDRNKLEKQFEVP